MSEETGQDSTLSVENLSIKTEPAKPAETVKSMFPFQILIKHQNDQNIKTTKNS